MSRDYRLFEVFGVEIEYMLVSRDRLDVLPEADRVLEAEAGTVVSEVELGELAWSNELVLHVIELKTNGPADGLGGLADRFQASVHRINGILGRRGMLLPGGMHPWMDPHRETRLWPHDYSPVYEALDRIFDCRGHGWSNLQSLHMNLPFRGDEEFGRLHSAVRLLLPLMPGLAAASPVMDGRLNGISDNRLAVYRENQRRIPSISGRVIPEPVFSQQEYLDRILEPMWRDIAPYDPEGILRYEWLNSRGAIARFERSTIEVRVLDTQECPPADLAVYGLIVEVLRALVEERLPGGNRRHWGAPVDLLAGLLDRTIRDGETASIDDPDYLAWFGFEGSAGITAGGFWREMLRRFGPRLDGNLAEVASRLVGAGTLSGRLRARLGPSPGREDLLRVYRELGDALAGGRLFHA